MTKDEVMGLTHLFNFLENHAQSMIVSLVIAVCSLYVIIFFSLNIPGKYSDSPIFQFLPHHPPPPPRQFQRAKKRETKYYLACTFSGIAYGFFQELNKPYAFVQTSLYDMNPAICLLRISFPQKPIVRSRFLEHKLSWQTPSRRFLFCRFISCLVCLMQMVTQDPARRSSLPAWERIPFW